MVHKYLWNYYIKRRKLTRYWLELEQFKILHPVDARLELGRRLLSQIKYFGTRQDTLHEWQEAATIKDPEILMANWSSLPILTKADLQERFHPTEIARINNLEGIASSTGGSTGEPTEYFHDREMLRTTAALRLYCQLQFGWNPGLPIIKIWGSERDIGKARSRRGQISGYLRNQWLIDGYILSDETVIRLLKLIEIKKPVAIVGFTSMLDFVSRYVLDTKTDIPDNAVQAAWNGGEMLYDDQVKRFGNAFGIPLQNLYGGREISAMAFQPIGSDKLRILRPFIYLEIVNEEGKQISSGEIGRLILTSTVCRGTPFLRYEIGDLGSYDPIDENESGITAIGQLHGRQAGLIELSDGRTINNIYWNHLFKEFPEVTQFQVVVKKGDRFLIRLKGQKLSEAREEELRTTLSHFLGSIDIALIWMENIPLTKQGKLLQVIRE